jgi:hypothetical protein
MGRPSKLTPETVERLTQAISLGASYELACRYAGVDYSSFRTWMRKGEQATSGPFFEFSQAFKRAEGAGAVRWLTTIERAAEEGAWQAAAWKLERRYPQQYARRALEVVDADAASEATKADDLQWAALREACRADVERFALVFFSHWLRDPGSRMHQDFFRRYRQQAGQRGLREVTAAPRGHAKTTIKAFIKTIHECVYGHESFIVVISSTQTLAEDKVKQIRDELETNALLTAVFGPQQGPRWNQGDFITASGVRVVAASPKTQIRGLLEHGQRLSKILLDDAEHAEHVFTQLQREKLWNWFTQDISKLGSAETNLEVIGTILHPESLLAKLLDNPGYDHARYQAVVTFATNIALWQQWRALFIDLDNPRRREDARAFFEANAEDMLAGSKVLWPEHESYYDLMVMRLVEGETAFQFEKQNNPLPLELYLFDMAQAGYFRLEPQQLVRRDGRVVPLIALRDEVVAFWDPSVGNTAESDWSCCAVLGRDPNGFMYALDTCLAQGQPPSAQVEEVVDLLWRWQISRIGLEDNTFQSLLISDLREAIARRALQEGVNWAVTIVPVTHLRAKPLRIATLEPQVANRWLWFNEALPAEYWRQFAAFRPLPEAGHDDAPDATEGAIRLLQGLR